MENFDAYISSNGYFVIPEYDIKYLIDFNESSIPAMAEATESAVRVAGRDGDIVLKTTYEPISFDIVCYTEENLTAEEKMIEEDKVKRFLNSIKNNTKTFAFEREEKFYRVQYNGSLTRINYPKHLKFSIPFKSSKSYAMNLEKTEIIGNNTAESDTIEKCGAVFTITGPAINPIIAFNDYQMSYDTTILDGNKLVIDTNNSTVTLINNNDVKTNAMRYYNHQFPKVQPGENELEVQSGIEDETQVKVEWYDLKL